METVFSRQSSNISSIGLYQVLLNNDLFTLLGGSSQQLSLYIYTFLKFSVRMEKMGKKLGPTRLLLLIMEAQK